MRWTYFDVKKGDYETITLEETNLTVTGDALKEALADDDGTMPKVQREVSSIDNDCLVDTSPSPRDGLLSRMPSSA